MNILLENTAEGLRWNFEDNEAWGNPVTLVRCSCRRTATAIATIRTTILATRLSQTSEFNFRKWNPQKVAMCGAKRLTSSMFRFTRTRQPAPSKSCIAVHPDLFGMLILENRRRTLGFYSYAMNFSQHGSHIRSNNSSVGVIFGCANGQRT